ncbi:hypothetical protein EV715DRAFT_289503 [Schizophyllum commune]
MAPKPTLARIRRSKASERRMLSVLCILGFILATVSVVGAYDSNPIYVTICGEAGAFLSLCVGLLQLFPAKQDPESDIELGSFRRDSRAARASDDRDDDILSQEVYTALLSAYSGPAPSPPRFNAFLRRRRRRPRSSSSASTPDITIEPPSRPSSSNSLADRAQNMDEEMASPYDAGIPLDLDTIPRAISPLGGRRRTKGTPALDLSVIDHELAAGNIARTREVAENSDMEKRDRKRVNEWNRMSSSAEAEPYDSSGVLRESPGWVNTSRILLPRIGARKRERHAASNTSSANGGDVPSPGSVSYSESDIVPARSVGNHFHDPYLGEDDGLTSKYDILQSPSDPLIIQRTAGVAPDVIVGVEQQRTAIDGEPGIDVSHLPQRSPPSPLRSFLVKTSLPCEPSVPLPLPSALLQEGVTDSDPVFASQSTISSTTSDRPLSPLGDLVWRDPYPDVTIRVIPADF